MTDRIRARHGNVIVGDFSRKSALTVGEFTVNLTVSVETIYADGSIIVLRCAVGTHSWHMLGDIASGNVVST